MQRCKQHSPLFTGGLNGTQARKCIPVWSVPILQHFCCQFWGKNICLSENIYSSVYNGLIYLIYSVAFLIPFFFHLCFSQRTFQDSSILVGSFLIKGTPLEWGYKPKLLPRF